MASRSVRKVLRSARMALTSGDAESRTSFLTGLRELVALVGFLRGLVVGLGAWASLSSLSSSRATPSIILIMSSRHFCFLGETSVLTGECFSFHSFTTSGFQNASRLGRRSAFGIAGFFLDGETSLEGLDGARDGVAGRDMGGALTGDRSLVGVGEYVSIARPPLLEDEVWGRDEANDAVRTRVGGGRCGATKEDGASGESVRSMTSCAQSEMVL